MSNFGQNFTTTVPFDDIVHFIDEENIVTYEDFDCGMTFYPEVPTKIRQINRERKYISRSHEKPKFIPSNDVVLLCRRQLLSTALLFVAHTKTLEKTDRISTKERFLLFSQSCILKNTADLLHFMLHRVLSVTSVQKVCCHKGIPHILTGELTCGSFQVSIWRLTITRIVFYFFSSK